MLSLYRLVGTGSSILISGNNRRDTFWGVDLYSWRGENQLGKIWSVVYKRKVDIVEKVWPDIDYSVEKV